MLIDTHCHLDAIEFDPDRSAVIAQARRAGVAGIVIPAVAPQNFAAVRELAHVVPGGAYALGIHPMLVHTVHDQALEQLEQALHENHGDPRLVAVGEIGLDRFVQDIAQGPAWERQKFFLQVQLRLAAQFELPVILHVRRAVDPVAAAVRRSQVSGGIAHAFNGSLQQAQALIDLGLALGVGGAMTFERALRIRRVAQQVPLEHLVLETDAPDIPPAWLHHEPKRNTPGELAGIAQTLAALRDLSVAEVEFSTGANAMRYLPRLVALLQT